LRQSIPKRRRGMSLSKRISSKKEEHAGGEVRIVDGEKMKVLVEFVEEK